MTRQVIVRPLAEADIEEAHDWYEQQQPGVGKEFIAEVDKALAKLGASPDLGILVYKHLRRLAIERFPYGAFYLDDGQRIVVVGVIHGRRSPRIWKRRLS